MITEKVKISGENDLIGILTRPKAESFPIVIIMHGFSGDKDDFEDIAKRLEKKGIASLRFDFHGRGESPGKIEETTLTKGVQDLKAAIEFVEKIDGSTDIGVFGYSYGAMVDLGLADERIKVHVMAAPASDPLEIWKNEKEWEEKGYIDFYGVNLEYGFYEDLKKYDLYKNAKKLKGYTLIIHGEDDEVVPYEQSKKLFECLESGKKLIGIKGCNHGFNCYEEMVEKTMEWFEKLKVSIHDQF